MTKEEAFALLGIPVDSPPEMVTQRFRELIRASHPDGEGTGRLDLGELTEARDVALGQTSSRELVPINQVAELVRLLTSANVQRGEGESQTRGLVDQLVRVHTARLKALQRRSIVFGSIAAGFGLVAQAFRGVPNLDPLIVTLASAGAIIYAGVAGLVAWLYRERARRLAEVIEDTTDTLDDRSVIVDVLNELQRHHYGETPLTRADLIRAADSWMKYMEADPGPNDRLLSIFAPPITERRMTDVAAILGAQDFVRLLIVKGLERGVLEEQESIVDDGQRLIVRYGLVLRGARR